MSSVTGQVYKYCETECVCVWAICGQSVPVTGTATPTRIAPPLGYVTRLLSANVTTGRDALGPSYIQLPASSPCHGNPSDVKKMRNILLTCKYVHYRSIYEHYKHIKDVTRI